MPVGPGIGHCIAQNLGTEKKNLRYWDLINLIYFSVSEKNDGWVLSENCMPPIFKVLPSVFRFKWHFYTNIHIRIWSPVCHSFGHPRFAFNSTSCSNPWLPWHRERHCHEENADETKNTRQNLPGPGYWGHITC